jgi:glycosyltransferase involved in cell wall biosynthesis
MRIIHIITGLGDGGAENTLFKVCKYDKLNNHIVISFKSSGKYIPLFKKINVKVYCLNVNFFFIFKFFSLVSLLRSLKPDIVQTWLVHADFIGSFAARLAGIKNIVWNVRYSKIEIGKGKLTTIFIIEILARISHFIPRSIIIVSKNAKKFYEIKGYAKSKLKFIPNGYDLLTFKINKKKNNLQKKLKINKKTPMIGYVARFDPLKDHLNLLKSISLLKSNNIVFFCVLVGTNINNNKILINEIKRLRLNNYVKLLGPSKNISEIMNSLDVHVQSSRSEGFPNVVAEAMAHKTPCVATNVGDTSYIVGDTGWIVPSNNPKKLAKSIELALKEIHTKKWIKRCDKARARIKEKFSIDNMINSYNKIWINVNKK